MKNISAVEARDQFAEIINLANYGKERVVVTRHGKAVAAVVPIEDLRKLEDMALQQALEAGNSKYGRMLKRLAE